MKTKTEQLHLFPELAPAPKHKLGVCMKCGRKILVGRLGRGCFAKMKMEINQSLKLLEEAAADFVNYNKKS